MQGEHLGARAGTRKEDLCSVPAWLRTGNRWSKESDRCAAGIALPWAFQQKERLTYISKDFNTKTLRPSKTINRSSRCNQSSSISWVFWGLWARTLEFYDVSYTEELLGV